MIGIEEKKAIIDLFPFMGERPVVFDVGSNKGHFSGIVLEEFKEKCHLHLFEPNEALLNFTRIRFEYDTNINFSDLACYKKDGEKIPFFYFTNFNNEISSIYNGGESWNGLPMKERMVDTITIDKYCELNSIDQIDYIKIDAEGADIDVLDGCRKIMSEGKVKIIQIEYSEHYKRSGKTFEDVLSIANACGYDVYRYIDGNFWKVKGNSTDVFSNELPKFDNYFLTKEEIHNYSVGGWNNNFLLSVEGLPKFDLCLEIGAFEGLTTKHICEKMLNTGGRINVIDPLNDYYVTDDPRYHPEFKGQYKRFKRNTRGLPVDLYRDKSENVLPQLHALRHDFCFIDGNHYPDWPYFDGVWAFAITKVGGYILFDDYDIWAKETKDSIDKFLNEFSGSFEVINKGYQILIRKTANQYNELTQQYY